jgi:nitrilase
MQSASDKILGGKPAVKVCIAQLSPAFMDHKESTRRAVKAIADAGKKGAELVVFPEAWLSGYPYWTEGWDTHLRQWAGGRIRFYDEAILVPGPITEQLGAAAKAAGTCVVIGCNEMDSRPGVNTIYNTLLFFDNHGNLLGRHRKLMPTFTERLFWGAGDGSDLEVYQTSIGRIGGLICGENLMTPLRAGMIAMGEDFHIAVFPGAFALHTGPRLEEWDATGDFWGHFVTRSHAFEAGCFTLAACAVVNPDDVPGDFPWKENMNIDYARGGSQIVTPLGVVSAPPTEGEQMIYADCEAWMIKAVKAIVDTMGHYSRPDVARVMLRKSDVWSQAGIPYRGGALDPALLEHNADLHEVAHDKVLEVAEQQRLPIGR